MSTEAANNGSWVCHPNNHYKSRGIFFGDSPFAFANTILLAQLSISSLLTIILQCLLNPLGQSSFISQMLVGLVLGPSFYGGRSAILEQIFSYRSFYVSETLAFFGCMVFMFLVGVKMDLTIITKSGTKAMIIGVLAFISPLIINLALAKFLKNTLMMEVDLKNSLIMIGLFQASSSFHVIACFLEDLHLLNSDIGRLALSSSMISGMLSWVAVVVGFTVRQASFDQRGALPWMVICIVCMVIMVVYILRPIMVWMIDQTNSSGRAINESYVCLVFVMLLFCALFSEFIGQHFMLGPMILGLAVPDGPPLGSALVDKLDSFVSLIILPCYFVISGSRIDLSKIHIKSAGIVHLLACGSFMGKLIGTVLPSLYFKMPFLDSVSLGLIMSAQGIADILILQQAMLYYMIDQKSYSMMVVAMVIVTGTISPIVKAIYNPSKKYQCIMRRRTIEHQSSVGELRLLVCIHHQDNTPSIINLLELSNPTIKTPICFYLLHLLQLIGRAAPLLISHHHHTRRRGSKHSNLSDQIINAFKIYEQYNYNKVIMNAFTSMAPYATMHDDVCMLALEKRVTMVIVPFHKRRTINSMEELTNQIRGVNKNILSKAPCSVGVLIDHASLSSTTSVSMTNRVELYRVGMIFVEGPDDREALAYAARMAEHPMVALTVVRLIHPKLNNYHLDDQDLDFEMINEFKIIMSGDVPNYEQYEFSNPHFHISFLPNGIKNCVYEEEKVSDCVGLINVIRTMERNYDLILVGRRHDGKSSLFMGLNEWNEYPELGFIGDMLACSDTTAAAAVLVVQQQTIGGAGQDLDLGDFRYQREPSFSLEVKPLNTNLPDTWSPKSN